MLNYKAIEEAYQEAVYAYEDVVRLKGMCEEIKAKSYECDHENARRKKDGARDKRYPCEDCLEVRKSALCTIDCVEEDYEPKWRFFAELGSPIK